MLPLVRGGDFSSMLEKSLVAARALHGKLGTDGRFLTAFPPELDIVVWTPSASSVSDASERSRALFAETARRHLHLALAELPVDFFDLPSNMARDRDTITCLRSVLMKPEHLDWIDRIFEIMSDAGDVVLGRAG
jgi:hypothetical protein